MTLIISRKLSVDEGLTIMVEVERFFQTWPKRRVCKLDLFNVRRGFVARDVLSHMENQLQTRVKERSSIMEPQRTPVTVEAKK